ncbi:MAG: translation initiation factor IF-3 [Thermaerobacter sp.]|nr:translation initiation factor IF-3 [Bacillota bacterium]REJ38289.1 MAG: translation initiation factor IF-3 [Bacillota bacterium]
MRVNDRIHAREVRLIGADGTQLGVMPLQQALELAESQGLDLVEVAPQSNPVVCRIMDYGKYRYEQQKREREARKRQRTTVVKEVKMSPNIDEHDFQVKLRSAERFLREGDKVKCIIWFRGRQIIHKELGRKVLGRMAEALAEVGKIERPPTMEGRNMSMILAPKADQR